MDFLLAVVTSEIAQILSLYGGGFLALWWVFSSEVEKLKWFCFDLVFKLALYTLNEKSSHNTVCVTYKAKSRYPACHWSVLEN